MPDHRRLASGTYVLHLSIFHRERSFKRPCAIVVIGASAGGLQSIGAVLAGLPARLDAAVFVVLHIPADAHSELAAVLQRRTRLTVTAAVDGEAVVAGRVYVGAPDRDLLIDQDRVRLTRGPKEPRSRPSVDALFRSAAVSGGPNVVGVVLSGALDDGAAGLRAIKDCGGVTLVQDPATAEYPSMPESAARYTVIDASLPADGLADGLADEVVRQVATMPRSDPQTDAAGLSIEVTIALEGDGLRAGVMKLGHVSEYTCPDCHGVLVQIEEGSMVRFRCHTGHAFTTQTLLLDVNAAIDRGLWSTLRAIEERVMLLRQMSDRASEAGEPGTALTFRTQADDSEERTAALRPMVVDPALFRHTR